MGIVVGRAARTRTPLFADAIESVIFRPFWYPSRSIIRNEIVPALRRNPGHLAAQALDIVSRSGDRATALPVTAANLARLANGSLALRQRPGPQNVARPPEAPGPWTRERIERAMDGDRTMRVDLPAPVPAFIYCTTAIVRHGGRSSSSRTSTARTIH
jgi:murein L,D-transpeptidase YcbB/YkuD